MLMKTTIFGTFSKREDRDGEGGGGGGKTATAKLGFGTVVILIMGRQDYHYDKGFDVVNDNTKGC